MKTFLYTARLALTLLVITGAVAAALAGVNMLTKDKIAAIQAEKTQTAISQVLEGEATALTLTGNTGMIKSAYQSPNGYAVEVASPGFGGEITMMVGVDHKGIVTGIVIINHGETAGLGSVAAEASAKGDAFRGQFVGISQPVCVDKDGGEIDSITGATISSRAVTEGVNAALEFVKTLG